MYNVDNAVKTLFKSDSVEKKYTIQIFGGGGSLLPADDLYPSNTLFPMSGGGVDVDLSSEDIVFESVKITESICDNGDYTFGKCNAAEITFDCVNIEEPIIGKELIVKMEIGGYTVPVGAYIVSSVERSASRQTMTVKAYDRISKFDKDVSSWYESLWIGTSSMTLSAFRASLCNFIGVPVLTQTLINDSLTITHTISPSELSGREVLEAICEINAVFGIINRDGFLKFVSLDDTAAVETIPISIQRSLEYEDYTVSAISGVNIRQENNDVGASVGSVDNPYVIQGNFLVYGKTATQLTSIATTVFNKISGVEYIPLNLSCRGLPYIEMGDCIDVTHGDSIKRTFVMSRTISGIQALFDEFVSTGNKTRGETFGLNKSILQLAGKTNILTRTVETMQSDITAVENGVIQNSSSISQQANKISMVVNSDNTINAAGIVGTINASPSSIVISPNHISLVGKSISLTSQNITIDSTNFSVDTSGRVTATSGKIGGWDMDATKLYSGSDGTYVALSSNESENYAIWAGNSYASNAPFSVTRGGYVTMFQASLMAKLSVGIDSFISAIVSEPFLSAGSGAFRVERNGTITVDSYHQGKIAFHASNGYGDNVVSEINGGLISGSLGTIWNSSYKLKIATSDNMSIDAGSGGTMYIGTGNTSETIEIGIYGSTIKLFGRSVYIASDGTVKVV